jgi:hypothetical protein
MRGVFVGKDYVRWNPNKPGDVWFFGETALFSGYLYHSRNYGVTTNTSVDLAALGFPSDNSVIEVAFGYADPAVIFAMTSYGMIKSTNDGDTWSVIRPRLPGGDFILTILNDQTRANAYFAAGGRKIFCSVDGGESFRAVGEIPTGFISCLAFDFSGTQLLIGSNRGIYALKLGRK